MKYNGQTVEIVEIEYNDGRIGKYRVENKTVQVKNVHDIRINGKSINDYKKDDIKRYL